MLRVEQLGVERQGRWLFYGLNWSLLAGECWLLRGPNGSGKTTLLRSLVGLSSVQAGQLHYASVTVQQIIYLSYLPTVIPELTVFENLQYQCLWAAGCVFSQAELQAALGYWGIAHLAEQLPDTLSQGQRQRLALSRLLLQPAELWLLDEPTRGLDSTGIEQLWSLCQAHIAAGRSVVLATHLEPTFAALDPKGLRTIQLLGTEQPAHAD